MKKDRNKKVVIAKEKLDTLKSLNNGVQALYISLGKLEEQYLNSKHSILSQIQIKRESLSSIINEINSIKVEGKVLNIDIESGEVTYEEKK